MLWLMSGKDFARGVLLVEPLDMPRDMEEKAGGWRRAEPCQQLDCL